MKAVGILAAFAALISFVVTGCQKQSQQTMPADAHGATHSTAPVNLSSAPTTTQKTTPAFVDSAAASTTEATTNANGPKVLEVGDRLNLVQADDHVVLQKAARTTIEAALSAAAGSSPLVLHDESAAPLLDNLPQEFRDSCDAMMAGWGQYAERTPKWTVWVLFSLRHSEGMEAVLAFRCASASDGAQPFYYDERPAVVALTPQSAWLNLIPLAEKSDNGPLFHLEFSQAYSAVGARLAELRVHHSTDNPCCGGGVETSGDRMMTLDLSRGRQALAVDERTEVYSHDDENGDTETVCEGKISYLRDGAGNVESIGTETRCTENEKWLPEIKKRTFRWNTEAHRFDEVK